ncbi:murein biosynthesis integral membrane protein MurJ [Calidifontibacter terrae]
MTEQAKTAGSRSILRSSAVMAAGTLTSRLLGLVRTVLLVHLLGATTATGNAWNTANTLPNMIYILLAGGVLNAVLVPQFTRSLKHGDGGKAYTDRLLTLALTILLGVTIVFTISAPLVYRVMDLQGRTAVGVGTAFALLCLPQIFFYGLYTLLGEALNSRGRFGAFMWAPALANVVSIAGIVWLLATTPNGDMLRASGWTNGRILVLAGTATLGIAAQALVLIGPLRKAGYSFSPSFQFRGVGLRTASTIAVWAFAAVVVQQLAQIVSMNVLNSVREGSGGSFTQAQAFLLFMLPHSLVTLSLVTALYTRLSRAAADGRDDVVRRDLDTGLRLSGLASIAVSIGAWALIMPLTHVLFDASDAGAIGRTTIAMMLGLVPFTVCVLEQRVFYAYEDAKTPFWMQVIATVVQVVGILIAGTLPDHWVSPGVAGAAAISYTVQATVGWILLNRRIGPIKVSGAVRTYAKLGISALVATAVAYAIRLGVEHLTSGRTAALITLVIGGGLFLVVYVAVARALHVAEITDLVDSLRRRLPGGRRGGSAATSTASTATPPEDESDDSDGPDDSDDSDPELERDPYVDADHTMAIPVQGVTTRAGVRRVAPARLPRRPSAPTVSTPVAPPATSFDTPPATLVDEPNDPQIPRDDAANLRMAPTERGSAAAAGNTPSNKGDQSVQGIEAGRELAGRYELLRPTSSNELKDTWQAKDETLGRDVVATVFAADAEHAAAALDSARRAAIVEDRHLPRVLDVGTDDNLSYVITESLTGAESIASLVQFDPLPAEEARRVVGEAANGLHTATGRGLHHLALTPHEIVRGVDGSIHVLGISIDAALSGDDDVPGAEASRTDAVALVAVLYYALTGRWSGAAPAAGLPEALRTNDKVAPVASLRRGVPGDLASLCDSVLNDDEGPRSPGDLARLLAPWSSEPVRSDDTGGSSVAAGAATGGATALSAGGDDTMVGVTRPEDPDATHTFDATAMTRLDKDDDYDPSFSDLEPPLPMLSTGGEDPDQNTSKLALAIVAAFVVVALVLGIIGIKGIFKGGSSSTNATNPSVSGPLKSGSGSATSSTNSAGPAGQKVTVSSITSFDPQGDGNEHNELAKNVLDGRTSTQWVTHIYGRADYAGGRKKGTGLLLDLGKSTQVGSVRITTAGNPSTIQVFVTDQKDSIDGLTPLGTMNNQTGAQKVTGSAPVTGRYVILWITQLSKGNQGGYREKIAEVEVLS